ncbi:MAG: oligoendopeptidase F [Chloroflexi bacterium]|nr:MAG: oligoendopeptidase F [Chloroflexota bacterium]
MSDAATVSLPRRDELPLEDTWALETIYATPEHWEQAFLAHDANLSEIEPLRGALGSSAAALLAGLKLRDAVIDELWTIDLYAGLRAAEDTGNATALAMLDRGEGLIARTMAALSFMEPELLAIDPATLAEFRRQEPALAEYDHYFQRLADRRAHVRSGEVEELLAMAGEPTRAFESIHTALSDADMRLGTITDSNGQTVELGQGNYLTYLHSPDRRVRQAAWETSSDAYLALRNTFAANYAGTVKRDVFYARARNYSSSLEAALAPERIPPAVVENLLAAVRANFPTWQRYFRARARLLGIEQAHTWDISEYPLAAPGKVEPVHFSWQQGIDLLEKCLAPMGDEYVGITLQGIRDRWVDRLPNIGKTSGAFSSGWRGQHPFILMTWHDDLGSVSTLAHELGHSIHSYYTWQTQPVIYSEYSSFVAEVASNFNQALMGAWLLENETDPNVIITTIEERMGNHLRYLFTMPILEMFEMDAHAKVEAGDALTAEGMIETLAGFYREGYGDAVALDHDRNGITWARFPHLFQPFYVFQYATGIAAAAQLAAQVRSEGQPAIERYTNFLKTGGAQYPVDALRDAGVDMLSTAPVDAAFATLAGYVDKLEELLDAME